MRRPCLEDECWTLTERTYCPTHRPPPPKRPALYRPQYGGDWPRLSREQRKLVPYCQLCGTDVDLVADHIVPGQPEAGLRTLCRACNSRRSGAGRGASNISRVLF